MTKQQIHFDDLGKMGYQEAWDYQESLLQSNVRVKSKAFSEPPGGNTEVLEQTTNHLLFVEHPHVYTLGKSGNIQHVLLNEKQLAEKQINFFHTNRGGDITYHGPGQLVGYPILDLEKFGTDIGKYLRGIEETIIRVLAEYGITGERSPGETGVWIEPSIPGKARKICAIGVRCSRWITMHGFALNVNTDLSYFNFIVPCGISNKQVTSLHNELGSSVDMIEVKKKVILHFGEVFSAEFFLNHEVTNTQRNTK